jgi:uncharacterized membrane protein YbaN (DUF454 family)
MQFSRYLYLSVGWFCVALGAIGIILPVFPTTPFLLVAVWAFSRSSPELAERIRNHPRFGHYVRHWQDHGVIPTQAKFLALAMMAGAGVYVLRYSGAPAWVGYSACAIMAALAVYILTRPSEPPLF